MATRKCGNIYFRKYVMAVRKFTNIFILLILMVGSRILYIIPRLLHIKKKNGPTDSVLCVFSSHSLWTSSSLDVPAGVTQKEGHTGFLIHLLSAVRAFIFLARRIQPFLSLVDREVEFCVLTI